jgi:hypothetical protein
MAGGYTTIVRGTNGKTDGLMEAFTKNPELDLVIGFTGGASGGSYGEYSNMKTRRRPSHRQHCQDVYSTSPMI